MIATRRLVGAVVPRVRRAAAACVLGWCATVVAHAQTDAGPVVPEGGASERLAGPYLARFPLESLSQTRDRPLFAPTRRPPPAAAPPMAALPPPAATLATPPPAQPQLTLLGFVRSPARGPAAVVMDNASRTSVSLRVGDQIQGWVVQSIEDRGLLLRNRDSEVTLTFPAVAPGVASPSDD